MIVPQISKFMGPTWGPPGSCRSQMGVILAPWTLLSGTALIRSNHSESIPYTAGGVNGFIRMGVITREENVANYLFKKHIMEFLFASACSVYFRSRWRYHDNQGTASVRATAHTCASWPTPWPYFTPIHPHKRTTCHLVATVRDAILVPCYPCQITASHLKIGACRSNLQAPHLQKRCSDWMERL